MSSDAAFFICFDRSDVFLLLEIPRLKLRYAKLWLVLDMYLVQHTVSYIYIYIYICMCIYIYTYYIYTNVDFLILKSSVLFPTITASNLSESSPKSMTIMTELDDNALHQMMLSVCNLQSPNHPVVSLYVFNVVLVVKKRLEAFCP